MTGRLVAIMCERKGEMLKLEKSTNDDNLLKVMCIIYVRKKY